MKLDPQALRRLLLPPSPPLRAREPRQAAVLLLICNTAPRHVYLTLRSRHLPTHAGQISLPGGGVEARDASYEATALREAEEETGLNPDEVELLGRLPGVTVSSGVEITPVVGWCEAPPALSPDPGEVEEIFSWPLEDLLDLGRYRRDSLERNGFRREFWVIDLEPYRVWGATAAILYSLARLFSPPR